MAGARRSYVDEICLLVGWRAGDFEPEVAWEAVERELGLRLPADYKELLTRFPAGGFRGSIGVDNPAQSREGLAKSKRDNLELMEIFADEDTGYLEGTAYRLFPEPGGLYPWGADGAGGTFWWVTDSPDPDAWSIAYNDYDNWREHPGPMTKVIHELLVSDGSDHLVGWNVSDKPVSFGGQVKDRMISYPL
ncbi:hypothetical protein ALI144C_17515 [Actinosynnema sp. ALI-1.44]|uniref:SMI1/KNR4 family protein n=1 Tax=Actinosynnema sp. ALI-1.44 TaxID=1933779 RepID=UPI00097BF5AD|nr:SMI1/KNR4 family protein [Actinosynnema sp. ALI-1.44]ONI82864.1 hypothetical protein ALI144C_17515 [Actinosynnema sp. ALI-1.44]